MQYPCGCINEVDEPSGVTRNVSKCDFHREWSRTHRESFDYYKAVGIFDDRGMPQFTKYMTEWWIPALEIDFDFKAQPKQVVELGCGISPYAKYFLGKGCYYAGIDSSEYAIEWMSEVYPIEKAKFICAPVEDCAFDADLIFSAHLLEHVYDAPTLLKRIHSALNENGQLFLIVPDDTDMTNPDHLWFFNQTTLTALLRKIGFKNIRSTMRRYVEHENFIFCAAEK